MSRELLDALPAIYDAAVSSGKWPEALDRLSSAVESRGAILVAFDLVGLPYQVQTWSTGYRDEDIQYYFQNFMPYEEKATEILRTVPARTICRDTDVWPHTQEVFDRGDYAFLRENYGVLHRAAVCLNKGKGWSDMLALQVCDDWQNVKPSFWHNLEISLPHIGKVVELNRTFSLLQLRYQAALAALDHIAIGMCIAHSGGQILLSNDEAKRIFSAGDGLSLGKDGRVRAHDDETTRLIWAAIDYAKETAEGEADHEAIAVACPRRSEGSSYLVEICALRDSAGELESSLNASLVCIIDPDFTRDISSEGLRNLYGFTPAETAICEGLVLGRTAKDMADSRNVSPETIRAQVKALYAKTGAANRVELIRLAIAASPPIK